MTTLRAPKPEPAPLPRLALVAAAMAAVGILNTAVGDETFVGHAGSHVAGTVLTAVVSSWAAALVGPRGRRLGPLGAGAQAALAAGVGLASAAQLLEAVAVRVEYPFEGALHEAFGTLFGASLAVASLGAILTLVAAARGRALPAWAALGRVAGAAFLAMVAYRNLADTLGS